MGAKKWWAVLGGQGGRQDGGAKSGQPGLQGYVVCWDHFL